MQLEIIAPIVGDFCIHSPIEAKLLPYTFKMFTEDNVKYISVSKTVLDYAEYAPKLIRENGEMRIIATNPCIYEDLEDWLVYFEAMGAFNFNVRKVYREELEIKWIPEDIEEQGVIPILSLKRTITPKNENRTVTVDNLFNIAVFRRYLPESHIPFSYFRHGQKFLDERNYYFAYINFFMMLEFCFAKGQFKKKDTINNFVSANSLKLAVLVAMLSVKTQSHNIYKEIEKLCQHHSKKFTFEDIIKILVEYRGHLAHGFKKSCKVYLDDHKLRPLAVLIGLICFYVCGNMQVYCTSTEKWTENRIKAKIVEYEQMLK